MNDLELFIDDLRKLCNSGKIKWTAHILMRLQKRNINPSDVRRSIMNGEIIEEYPTDYPYPSCLVLGLDVGGHPLHVVVGCGGGFIWLITAYYPDIGEWQLDLKTRRKGDKK